MAGGLSFSLFVCIVPFVLIIFSALGMIFERPTISQEIGTFIDRVIPYQHQADIIERLVLSRVSEFKLYKSIAGWVGLVGLFIAASGLFSSMRTILNSIFRVKGGKVDFLIGKLRDLGLVLLVMVYFLISIAILPSLEVFTELATKISIIHLFNVDFLQSITTQFASMSMIFILFFIIYFYIPMTRLPFKVIILSALSASILWEVARYLFGIYIENLVTLDRVYGAYALLVMAAFWIYYSAVVFIVGAEIGQLCREKNNLLSQSNGLDKQNGLL